MSSKSPHSDLIFTTTAPSSSTPEQRTSPTPSKKSRSATRQILSALSTRAYDSMYNRLSEPRARKYMPETWQKKQDESAEWQLFDKQVTFLRNMQDPAIPGSRKKEMAEEMAQEMARGLGKEKREDKKKDEGTEIESR